MHLNGNKYSTIVHMEEQSMIRHFYGMNKPPQCYSGKQCTFPKCYWIKLHYFKITKNSKDQLLPTK